MNNLVALTHNFVEGDQVLQSYITITSVLFERFSGRPMTEEELETARTEIIDWLNADCGQVI